MNLPVLIPAYKPNEALLELVHALVQGGVDAIVIVNDGSGPESGHIFDRLATVKQCHVLHHAVNLGKGRAIKTGLNYCYLSFQDAAGVVTADADGQHLAADVIKVAETFLNHPQSFIIGTRRFHTGTPLRSMLGNLVTKYVFRVLVGKRITDTQSGLRCIPRTVIPRFLQMAGEKYEYEMNMLIATKTYALDVVEAAISTVYIDKNRSSHFNPLIDSMKIYFLLLRFTLSSFLASIIDFTVFGILYFFGSSILTSIVFARLIAGTINFFINRGLVFHSREHLALSIAKYYALILVMGSVAYITIQALSDLGINVMLAKILTETVLFIASFSIQRDFIFSNKLEQRGEE